MSVDNLFGSIIGPGTIEDAVTAHLKAWTLTYIAELEREIGFEPRSLPPVRSYVNTPQAPDKWAEDQLPALLIVSPGLAEPPRIEGDGKMSVIYEIGVGSICSAATERRTTELAYLYFFAAMLPMLRNASLGGFSAGVQLAEPGWDHAILPVERRRTLASAYAVFNVAVDQVFNVREGPIAPLTDPYADPGAWTIVEKVFIDTSKMEGE